MTSGDPPPRPAPSGSRGELLARAGRSAVVLVAGGVAIAWTGAVAGAQTTGDLATLRMLAAGERLASELYTRASAAAELEPPLAIWIEGALANERDHEATLAAAAPSSRPGPVHLRHAGGLSGPAAVLSVALALEFALVGAYLGAVAALRSPDLRVMAAAIGANEAQHLAAVRHLAAGHPQPDLALAPATTAPQARRALGRLATGSRIPS